MRYRNLIPSQWDSLSKADREEMMADYLSDKEMEGWENYQLEQASKKSQLKNARGLKR